MVEATLELIMVMRKTPRKLKTAAINMACLAEMARVETQVAMALGASVQPFTRITPSVSTVVTANAGLDESPVKKSDMVIVTSFISYLTFLH